MPVCPNCSKQLLIMANLVSCRHCGFYTDNNNENLHNPMFSDEP